MPLESPKKALYGDLRFLGFFGRCENQGRSLPEVLTELQRQSTAKKDFISPAQAFRLDPDGETFRMTNFTSGTQEHFGVSDLFHRQVGSALGIPAKYYDQMRMQKPDLLAENVNAWFKDRDQRYMVRTMDYGNGRVARALLSDRYRRIDNMEIAAAILPLFAGKEEMEVISAEVTENRLYLLYELSYKRYFTNSLFIRKLKPGVP